MFLIDEQVDRWRVRRKVHGQRLSVGRDIVDRRGGHAVEDDELHRLMEDYYHHRPLDFWFPVILAPHTGHFSGASFSWVWPQTEQT